MCTSIRVRSTFTSIFLIWSTLILTSAAIESEVLINAFESRGRAQPAPEDVLSPSFFISVVDDYLCPVQGDHWRQFPATAHDLSLQISLRRRWLYDALWGRRHLMLL